MCLAVNAAEVEQGHGYAQWFLIMAVLHPLAWLLLYFGGVHRKAQKD